MSAIAEILQKLSPEKRALLGAKLPPLSFAQQRMWFLDYYKPDSHYYTIANTVQLAGPLNVPALERSFTESIRRHQVLRTNFVMLGDHPVQFVNPAGIETLPIVDLSELPPDQQLDHAQQLATEESQRPFDLTNDKLVRLSLLRLDRDKHVLVLAMHHIVGDGWSTGVLIRELSLLYDAYSHGREPQLPELPIQYTDYAVWQRNWLQGEVLEKELEYWRRQLSDPPAALELPADRPRPALQSHRGAHYTVRLSPATSDGLKALGQEETVTTFMLLMAAFNVFLYRYTGQKDICIGTPIAGRNRIESEALIGLFVNTLVIRAQLSEGQSFREVLHHARDTALEAFAHQNVPFERLVEVLQPERSLNRTPFFQVMFSLQNATSETPQMGDLKLEFWKHDKSLSQFDFMLTIVETDRFNFTVEYSTDLFDETTIERMMRHFRNLLEEIVLAPGERIERLSLLKDDERRQTVEQWNQTQTDYPRESTIHALFEHQATRTPDAPAVVCGDVQLTYGDLNERANQLAHHLRALGVGPDVLVAVCLERSVEMIVACLGVLKAGGAYVPLDPSYPKQRLAAMLADSEAPVLLTTEQAVELLPSHRGEVVLIDSDWPGIARQSTGNPAPGVHADNLAYVIYTSGSTGQPKGVCVPHRAVVRLVINTNYITLTPSDVVAQVSNVSFDAATFEIWGALLNCARLVVMPPEQLSLAELGHAIEQQRVTTLWLTAGLFHLMVDEQLESLRGLKYLLAGGDVLSLDHVERFRRAAPHCQLINGYGPTENTTFTACHLVKQSEEFGASVPIGQPIANTQVYILDQEMNVAPVGVFGELYTGGDGLARGYLRGAELTAERFVPDSISGRHGSRLYRTGDRARRLASGDIEFLGRIDNQVKLRGFRVELGEIEALLGRHSGVSRCVVVARSAGSGDKRLVAYVVAADEATLTHAELRNYLQERLPDYMVPASFVFLDELPLTPNGKVARKELPEPEIGDTAGEAAYVAPRSPVEEMLADIWLAVLNSERIGVTDDFFELGGHSLLATQVISRVREVFGVEVPLRELFEYPTIAGFAKRVDEATRQVQGPQPPPIRRVAREHGLPLSFAQQRLWFLHQLKPESAVYNMSSAMRLGGGLDVAVLQQTLDEVVRRHEVLRTTFAVQNGEPVQVIGDPRHVPLPIVDLSELNESERETESRRLVTMEAQQPFDLSTGPLLRIELLRLSREERVLLLTVHHIISDGWSIGVMVREVATLFAAFSNGQSSPLPELAVQYADFAVWQREWFRDEVLEREIDYWRNQLSGSLPVLELAIDKPRPAVQSFSGSHESLGLDEQISKQLRELSRREGVTLFMTLLAAWQLLLSRYTGQEDIVVGTPIAGRNRLETEDLIGFFVNTLVLRTDLGKNPTFREVLKRVRDVVLGAYSHQDVPFERLVDELETDRSLSHTPLFQVAIALQNTPQESLNLSKLELSEVEAGNETAKFDLTLTLAESEQLIGGALVYNSDLFEPSTIKRMVSHYTALLRAVIKHPDLRLSELPLLSEAEREQLVEEFNTERLDYSAEELVPQLFAAQVRRAPDALAVVHEGQQLSYGELHERAEKLARHLVHLGVGPETVVGVCLERSVELVVALLAVLKAGAAYLPLDVSYPAARLAFMLSDARAAVLLTETSVLPQLTVPAQTRVVCCDADLKEEVSDAPLPAVSAANLAYVIYTSGSTGQPKGVMISHGALLNLVQWHNHAYELTSADRVTQLASVAFDAAVWELWPALSAGASVHLVPEAVRTVAWQLPPWLSEQGVTVSFLPTPLAEQVLRRAWPEENRMRVLLTGGDQLHEYGGGVEFAVVNHYGPTEATVLCTAATVERSAATNGTLPPIGRAIANTQVYVLDEWQQLAPLGVVGELYIGGAGVGRGYLGRAELTAERFVPDGVSGRSGARLYRTGDLVRYGAAGMLEYVGRVDQQVKVRGYRIELGEIEAVLREHEAVAESVVVAQREQGKEARLVAYVTGQFAEEETALAELRQLVQEKLPPYMAPASYVVLAELPLTANGKVDRKLLPAPGQDRKNYVAPRDQLQQLLVEMWKEILGVEELGIHDDFFSLNGDSIRGAIFIYNLREKLGDPVHVDTIFKAPTIARLADHLRQEHGTAVERLLRRTTADYELKTAQWSPLVTLQQGYQQPPLFLVHPVGGTVFCYAHLVGALGPEYTIYGLQARGLDDGQSPLARIEEMAAEYLAAIESVQPDGPYQLAGWSMGALIAFEMARQLHARGEETGFLGLIDPTDPEAGLNLRDDAGWVLVQFAMDLGLTMGHLTRPVEELMQLDFDDQLQYLLELAKSAGVVPVDTSFAYLRRLFAVFQNNVRAVTTYQAAAYDGEVTLFTARERLTSAPEPLAAWSKLARGGVRVCSIPGNHYSIFRLPHVQSLAQQLKASLTQESAKALSV